MTTMRILHLVETLHVGGLERVVIDLVRQQVRNGHQCRVICLFEKGMLASELENQGIPVSSCNKQGGLDRKAIGCLSHMIGEFDPVVVHSHNITCNYYAALALLKHRHVRLINTRHGIGQMSTRQKWLFALSLPRTRWVAGVCEQATGILKKQFPLFRKRICTVPNGIVLDRHPQRSDAQHASLMEELNLPGNSLAVAIVARLNPVKNHAMLIEAFSQVHQELEQARLIIIGDGPLRSTLVQQVERMKLRQAVLFLGDRRDIPGLLAGMDLFVLPSTQEGHSISLLEACACGLPIVATRVGGNPEIIRQDVNGLLIDSGDTQALAAAILQLLEDDKKRHQFGHNSRTWAETEGSVQTMARRYEALYTP